MTARAEAPDESAHGVGFWIALVVGGASMAWGAWLFWESTSDGGARVGFVSHIVGIDLLHDLLVAPLICLVGVTVALLVRGTWRAPVQAGLIISGSLLIVAVLPLWRTAEGTRNPTIQPLDYRTATLTALGATWIVVVIWGALRSWRRARPR